MHVAFGVPQLGVGIGLVVLTAVIIFGGVRTIARVAELIVPVMALVYLLLALYVVGINISKLPDVIALIVKSAFGWQEAAAGTLAYTISQAMINGVKRGLFSNEAGMGSAPNAAAAASPYPPHPASQGYVQMLGVFMDTIVICTATAAIILTSGTLETGQGMSGIDLTQRALSTAVGDWGAIFIAVAVFFFAFTSIIANYAYAETNLVFLEHNGNKRLLMFRGMVLGMVIFGAVAELPIVWAMADISMGLMALTNLIAILLLSGTAIKLAKDYNEQLDSGKLPVFDVRKYPELHSQLEPGIWDDPDVLRKMAE
ncbi:MAG: alanine/glycine:cation symporter family protein, partial [Plesiomonas shigelloides]